MRSSASTVVVQIGAERFHLDAQLQFEAGEDRTDPVDAGTRLAELHPGQPRLRDAEPLGQVR